MISVIITAYNRPDFLGEAIDSALAQTYADKEVIVVDDGSTEPRTREVLAAYGDRIRAVRKDNGGVASARNAGIRASKGEILAFLDDDDAWLPEKLARQAEAFEKHPEVGLVYTNCIRFDERGELPDRDMAPRSGRAFKAFVEDYFIVLSTMAVRRACVDAAGLFDQAYRRQDDLDFMARVLELWPCLYLEEPLIRRRKYGRPIRPRDVLLSATEQRLYVDKMTARYGATGKLPWKWTQRKTASVENKLGRYHEMMGDARQARAHYARAIAAWPWKLAPWRRWIAAP
ncbi:MAG: glycosyltransferase family 2 protein, partial [Candidatus Methylomirabilis sp.]|nr:glycosyltransferase family 2 protein [Deltaproteobacteria bacterium]